LDPSTISLHDALPIWTFKLSKDPKFVEKLTDVVGLYLNPPDKAAVLCVDEKSMIQALDRTQHPRWRSGWPVHPAAPPSGVPPLPDRKSTRLNSSHVAI